MSLIARGRALWRRQPALQALAAGLALVHGLSGIVQLAIWSQQMRALIHLLETPPDAPPPSWPPQAMPTPQMLALYGISWPLGLLALGLWAWLLRGLARAYAQPDRPVTWSDLFHRAWEPVVRLLAGLAAAFGLNLLVLYGVLMPLTGVVMLPLVVLTLVRPETLVLVFVLLLVLGIGWLVGMVLWFPWSLNLVLTPVLQTDTASPPELVSRWWRISRRGWRTFLSLALVWGGWVAGYTALMLALMLAPLLPWLQQALTGRAAAAFSLPWWLWPLAFVVPAAATGLQAGLLSLWVVAYLGHHTRAATASSPSHPTGG